MNSDVPFRSSIYFTLAMSSVCLGYSEWDYLPEVTAFTCVVILAMIAAFVLDSRDRHLTLRQANLAGGFIFALAAGWLSHHYLQPDSLMHTLPWPAGGLPYLAPLLMLLIPAKLFRPKHDGDWWGLYCISLACVGLAMSLAEEIVFMLLVFVYAAVSVWSLTLFYLHRSRMNPSGRHLGRSLRWLGLAALVAAPIFFLTPRTAGVPWELFNAKLETGLPTDGSPDLSRIGTLKPSRDVAFEVIATNADGTPRTTVPADARWRNAGYADYQSPRGRWVRTVARPLIAPTDSELWRPTQDLIVPDLGPDRYQFDFRIVGRSSGPVFADPVWHRPGARTTIAVPMRGGYGYAVQIWDGSFAVLQREIRFTNRYIQLMPGSSEPSTFTLADPDDADLLAPFKLKPPDGVILYGHRLLERLIQQRRLPPEIANRARGFNVHPDDHATVADAFAEHLGVTGGFSYSLNLRRQDKTSDPVEDFLENTKSGHCERFASALVLLLRSVGIPSQLVLGYRGCEQISPGRYVIRQDDAHAWAEVLLTRTANGKREWLWQTLDPTPASAGIESEESGSLLESSTKQTQRLFSDYVINLNPDTQRVLTEGASEFFAYNWPLLAAVPVGIAIIVSVLRWMRRTRRAAVEAELAIVPWYTRLVSMLQDAGLPPVSGETPKEWAVRARNWLKQNHSLSDVELPSRAAEVLYQLRFAEMNVEVRNIETATDQLAAALKKAV